MTKATHTNENLKRIESAKLKFHQWRSDPLRKLRIPDELWRIAVDLANVIGPTQTRKLLSLDYVALKKKMLASKPGQSPAVQFVKLDLQMTRSFDCRLEIQSISQSIAFDIKGIEVDALVQLIHKLESK